MTSSSTELTQEFTNTLREYMGGDYFCKETMMDMIEEFIECCVEDAHEGGFNAGYKEGMYDSLPANVYDQYRLRARVSDADL